MAHQAHALPWQMLASHFNFGHKKSAHNGRTNLYPCFKSGQGKQLQHFARAFARLMAHDCAQERTKYPQEPIPLDDGEIFIPDSTVKRIAETVKWYKTPSEGGLSDEERKLPYWLDSFHTLRSTCALPEQVRQSMELLKTLIMHGDMEPLLRLAAHPEVRLPVLSAFPCDSDTDISWADIKNSALIAYVCLNMFLLKPELYDPTSRSQRLGEVKEKHGLAYPENLFDYRNTSSYQKLLTHVTYTSWKYGYGVCALPHRKFFGIDKDMITTPYDSELLKDKIGVGPPSQLLDARYRSWYVPTAFDVSKVLYLLTSQVPIELALGILEYANYTAKRRVPVPNDPLHADNAEELKKYLDYCWKVLVRIDMLVKANGNWIDWEFEITEVIHDLWGVRHPRMSTTMLNWEYNGRTQGDVDQNRMRRTFK